MNKSKNRPDGVGQPFGLGKRRSAMNNLSLARIIYGVEDSHAPQAPYSTPHPPAAAIPPSTQVPASFTSLLHRAWTALHGRHL